MEKYLQSCKSEFWKKIFKAESDYILDYLRGCKDILTIGCGPAIIETGLVEKGFNVTGLDVSQQALNQAPDTIRTIVGHAEKMNLQSQSFDAVIYVASMQFIEKYKEAIGETVRVLKSDGKLLAMLLNPKSEFFKERNKNPNSYVNRIRHINLKEIEKTIANSFFIETEYFLGIKGTEIFQSQKSDLASLYVIKGTKK